MKAIRPLLALGGLCAPQSACTLEQIAAARFHGQAGAASCRIPRPSAGWNACACLLLHMPVQPSLLFSRYWGGTPACPSSRSRHQLPSVLGSPGSCRAEPAMHCLTQHGVRVQDGKQVLTGWSDGKIRVFGPESGKELYSLHDAHHGEASCPGWNHNCACHCTSDVMGLHLINRVSLVTPGCSEKFIGSAPSCALAGGSYRRCSSPRVPHVFCSC